MTTYYRCDGSIAVDSEGGSQCSTGWLVVDEPTFTLVTQEQAAELIAAVLLLWALVQVYKILLNLFGVSR